ncbi:MAG TPA: BPSS1780 family membrane protein [Casimicrobiaceae bacterium]|nr:BPSS1780 family membrane protein [Casimicrobiaceae bacterium]
MTNEPSTAGANAEAPSVASRGVEAGRGASWWGEGWRLFVPSVGPWLLIVVILIVLQVCLQLIPIVGHLANSVLFPVLAGGLMLGCRAVDQGEPLSVSHLFAGFSTRTGPLLIAGLLYTAITLAIVLVVAGILLASFGTAVLAQLFELQNPTAASRALGHVLLALLVGALLFLALYLPLIMAMWFAPALVVLRGVEPWAAMKLSFSGCLKNIGPFLVYGVIGILLAVVASIPLLLGWLVLGPVTIATIYTGYCDIFEEQPVS